MTLPKMKEVEIPLLHAIESMGGEGKPQELYPKVTAYFPQITTADLGETISGGVNKWTNKIQWARQSLVLKGELERYPRGLWRITDKGKFRLKREGRILKGDVKAIKEKVAKPLLSRHEELKQKMVNIGMRLGYHTTYEERLSQYQPDVLWKRSPYKRDPCHVIEICGGGSLPKDFDSLNWARENLGARGILVTVDEADYNKAVQRFGNQSDIVVTKAETVDRLHELINVNLELLKSIFDERIK
ncbi:MAG: hypothetical protein A2Y59_00590 [Chloroflexi bacterium RBG_13_52_14]|nr:MAG: hypothetical protein A2Y59_00590 [Chloroflexi bacterium RBG_13_52_14]